MAGASSVVYVETQPGRFEIRPVTLGPILRDKIVILAGLKTGEQVATAGNFLIDSQMQLAGKPSLIDSSRAIAKTMPRKGPLAFENIEVKPVGGETGQRLEKLYAAYFLVQQALAADKTPPQSAAVALHQTALTLAGDAAMPKESVALLQEVAAKSEHLHHLDMAVARKQFKPVSHAIVTLAAQVRSSQAQTPLLHYYCFMGPEGGADWVQPGGDILNPYMGVASGMLSCAEKVHVFPARGKAAPQLPAKQPAAGERKGGG